MALTSCANWHGIANVPMPGGPGSGPGSYTVYVQMPDTLALNDNSRVRVADVFVGTVRAISLKNWVATLTLRLDKSVKLPKNATAKIGQTSLLGSQHVELAAPPNPSPELLKDGDTIPLKNSSAYPTTEQTLASLALILRGGGIPNLETLQNEIYNILNGRADQIRAFLGKLDTFTARLNEQRDDITRAIDSTNRLLAYVGPRSDVLDRVLTEFPPLIKHFADKQNLLINAVDATGRLSQVADQYLSASRERPPPGPAVAAVPVEGTRPCLAVSDPRTQADPRPAVRCRRRAEVVPRRLLQPVADARSDPQRCRQRGPHRDGILRSAARARAIVGPRPRNDDPRCPVHAEP